MNYIYIAVPIVCVLGIVCMWYRLMRSAQATFAMCEASRAFFTWRLEHPGVAASRDEHGQHLLEAYLSAYERFLRTHRYVCTDTVETMLTFERTLGDALSHTVH